MIPIGDDNSGRRITPLVTYALVAINVMIFLLELSGGDAFVMRWAFVPTRFLADPAGSCRIMPHSPTARGRLRSRAKKNGRRGPTTCGRRKFPLVLYGACRGAATGDPQGP